MKIHHARIILNLILNSLVQPFSSDQSTKFILFTSPTSSLVPLLYDTVGPCYLSARKNEIIICEMMTYVSIERPTIVHKPADAWTASCKH